MTGHDEDGYEGPALLVTADHAIAVEVMLRGFFQPVDGRYHWHGRLAGAGLAALAGNRHRAVLVTGAGQGLCDVFEPDLWGRFAVSGVGTPPFELDLELPPAAA